MVDLLHSSALELAELIRRRAISSEEATTFYLERIGQLDGELSSFVTVLRRRALWAARRCDKRIRRADEVPLFHGVPCGIKDLVPMLGTPTKLGSRAYRWFVAPVDFRAAKLIKQGGFVVLGKLATSEFGVLPVTEPDIHPPTRNPWDLAHTPGGSSGGSGAAVAAGFLPMAQGSDGGGSVRIPASLCHLFGFKPSLSLLGNMHGAANMLGMSTMGPLAQTVDDAAAMLDVLRGEAFGDLAERQESCLARCQAEPKSLRIRILTQPPIGDTEPEIVTATEEIGRMLEQLGHHVEPLQPLRIDLEEFLPLWETMVAAVPTPGERWLEPVTQWIRAEGRRQQLDAVKQRQRELAQRLETMMEGADILLTPTVPVSPPTIGSHRGLAPEQAFAKLAVLGAFTAPFNISRGPAASVPAGVSSDGFPIGVQLGGRPGADHLVLSLSRQLERARAWRHRRAPFVGRC